MTVDEFIREVESAYKKQFSRGFIKSKFKKSGFGAGIVFHFGVQNKSDWVNNIFHNDPSASIVFIRGDFDGDEMPEKVVADMSMGGGLMIESDNPHMAFDRVKIGWRKKTGSPEKVARHMATYFAKMKQTVKNNQDKLKHKVAGNEMNRLDRKKIARELVKVAKDLMAGPNDSIITSLLEKSLARSADAIAKKIIATIKRGKTEPLPAQIQDMILKHVKKMYGRAVHRSELSKYPYTAKDQKVFKRFAPMVQKRIAKWLRAEGREYLQSKGLRGGSVKKAPY